MQEELERLLNSEKEILESNLASETKTILLDLLKRRIFELRREIKHVEENMSFYNEGKSR